MSANDFGALVKFLADATFQVHEFRGLIEGVPGEELKAATLRENMFSPREPNNALERVISSKRLG